MDGRKIEESLENPFDNIFIDIASWMNVNLFKPLHFTPNYITTLSLLVGIAGLVLLHLQDYIGFIILFLLSYLLDCADGNYARRYGMVTKFGDMYDHVSDISKTLMLLCLIAVHPIPLRTKILFLVGFIILGILANVHLGCQERVYSNQKESKFLSFSVRFCPTNEFIHITRYVGVGTLQMAIVVFVLYLFCMKN